MMSSDGSSRLKQSWPVIWLLGLAVVYLSPALQTGYWAEDLYQSITPRGSTVLENGTLWSFAIAHVKGTILMGRFFPLTAVLISTVHYVIHDVWYYKAYILSGSVLDLFLFYLLVQKLSGRREFACFTACVTIGLIQYRVTVDPSLGFFGQMQLLIALLLLSLLTLQLHLESKVREWKWLGTSVFLYLACALLYEVSYALLLLHICLICRARDGSRQRFWAALPFVGVVALCVFLTVLVRWLYPFDIYWQHADFDPPAVIRAIAYQLSASLPLSYFLADPLKIFPHGGAAALFRWLLPGQVALVALSAFGLCCYCLRKHHK
jgi:hypothetical protein